MDGANHLGFRSRPYWWLALLLVLLGQTGLSLERLGGTTALLDDRPIVAGRHPLHLYHAMLGAETFRLRYSTTCYDPAFQAGYPKTPVFDGGCRPAELCLYLGGAKQPIVAYKLGLFVLCLAVPLAFALAGRGVGLSAAGCCLAASLGCGVWWTAPVQALITAGDIDLLLAGLCSIVFVAWLSRYHWDAGPMSWLLLAATAIVGWYAHPVVWIGLLPVVALYYFALAPRHGPAWHLGLVGITFAGFAPNLWWLWDWGRFWWLRQPSVDDLAPFPTWGALLGSTSDNLALLGSSPLGWPLAIAGTLACATWYAVKHRSATLVLLGAALLAALVARLGETWAPFLNGGTARAAPLAVALAVFPVVGLISLWARQAALGWPVLILICTLPAVLAWSGDGLRQTLKCESTPIALGLTATQLQIVDALNAHTDDTARILIEDVIPGSEPGWNWTALLPTLAPRAYLGGLDPEARTEHAHCGLLGHRLNGKLVADWSNTELIELCKRYNIGWVLARSEAATTRFLAIPGTRSVARFDGAVLLALERPKSFVLQGQAKWEQADLRKVVLTDVVPADSPHPDGGPLPAKVIVLSLHHQPGLRVSPNIVIVERDPDSHDPIPMIRLRMSGPLSRIVLSWENR